MKVKKDHLLSFTKLFNQVHCINYTLYTVSNKNERESQINVQNAYLKLKFLLKLWCHTEKVNLQNSIVSSYSDK